MATSVVCDNAAVQGFELLKLSENAEIDGEIEQEAQRLRPTEGCGTHAVTVPRREKLEVHNASHKSILPSTLWVNPERNDVID